ncbi:restriction endonuclease subunit S [Escherichia coli]|uniref:restriction endonuclease subunit S n=1 Tax=Escherichia coli TaxID=562 RepID=UPI000750B196|nr:restriction endonuclease subunit S [Escherichia coli]EFJ6778619.1 restriction endonuclease subunit S [Escherichia coli]EJA1001664.1 restriction endonuclease subunit S [Escherichia coli]EKQ4428625.1 restriction endonuclease subunit S [Escherichia coli]KUW74794.1 restriction endonuclease subunit S [Escherichia coli]
MVPKGWSSSLLGEIMSFKNGLNFTKTDNGDSVKIVGVGDFKDLSELSSTEHLELISVAGRIRDEELLNNGDLLFVRSNGNKDLIGRCMFFPEVRERLSFSGFTIRGRVINESTLPAYMAIVARSSQFQMQISKASGGTNISNLSQQILNDINLLLPPLIEQKKIAEILSTWDKAISVTEKLLANSQRQKKALMQQLLTGKKRLLNENGVRFNGKWEKKLLSDVADVYQPKTISQSMMSDSGYPVYGANGVIGFYQEFNHETEQIAVTCRGSTCGIVNWTQAKSWITGNAMVINTDNYSYVSKKFLFYTLNGSDLKYLISGSGQPQITGNIKTHIINLPCIEEQQKIATVLSAADAEIYTLEKKLACLRDEKKALMQQLLTGKRRVKVDEAVAE